MSERATGRPDPTGEPCPICGGDNHSTGYHNSGGGPDVGSAPGGGGYHDSEAAYDIADIDVKPRRDPPQQA